MKNITDRVLEGYSRIENPRTRFLITTLIKHLLACVQDMQLTDQEYEFTWNFLERMAAFTGPERNEFLLFADVVGISQLVEEVNHNKPGQEVGFALVGPFFRAGTPFRKRGSADMSPDTAGARVHISGRVFDSKTKKPITSAVLDTWQAATNGLYENQDDSQPDYNLRGRYRTADDGSFELIGLMPTPYPVPTDGPVGELLRLADRPPYRPAHIHFIVTAPGYETLVTQIFVEGDKQIQEDVVFTADERMIGKFEKDGDNFKLIYDFPMHEGVSTMPEAPIPA